MTQYKQTTFKVQSSIFLYLYRLNLSKLNLKFELKSNFKVRKPDISKLNKYRVTLEYSKIECKEIGGLSV